VGEPSTNRRSEVDPKNWTTGGTAVPRNTLAQVTSPPGHPQRPAAVFGGTNQPKTASSGSLTKPVTSIDPASVSDVRRDLQNHGEGALTASSVTSWTTRPKPASAPCP
jgi:hypothetical protein